MITLYARAGSGSAVVEAVLEECNIAHNRVEIPRHGADFEAYLMVNPRGEVPSLRLSDHSLMTESAAMVIYLSDLYPQSKLAPPIAAPERPQYLRWMLYFASSVYLANLRFYYPARHSIDPAAEVGIKAKSIVDLDRDFTIFANALGQSSYILGEIFSAVDIYAAMLVSWAPDIEAIFARHPNMRAYYARVTTRPSVAIVWAANGLPLL
ncbi:MAG: glutathione S-transferase family protein [Alphaproteobacteria bacterium]|nr:glutathione S-transferase family protein [Alphaproteobacteria bacterium]